MCKAAVSVSSLAGASRLSAQSARAPIGYYSHTKDVAVVIIVPLRLTTQNWSQGNEIPREAFVSKEHDGF